MVLCVDVCIVWKVQVLLIHCERFLGYGFTCSPGPDSFDLAVHQRPLHTSKHSSRNAAITVNVKLRFYFTTSMLHNW